MAAPLPLGCATRGKCTIKKLIFAKNVYFCSMLQATVGVQPFLLWGSQGGTCFSFIIHSFRTKNQSLLLQFLFFLLSMHQRRRKVMHFQCCLLLR